MSPQVRAAVRTGLVSARKIPISSSTNRVQELPILDSEESRSRSSLV